MLNRCLLMGRLTKDPEIHYTKSDEPVAVAKFSLAVDRKFPKGDKKTDFFDVEAWRKRAEKTEKYLKKGMKIVVEGSFQQDIWDDTKGNKRVSYILVMDDFFFAESKKENLIDNGTQNTSPDMSEDFDPFAKSEETDFDPFNQ